MNFTRGYGVQQPEGLTRQEYQQLVASETGPGVSAARSAQRIKETGEYEGYRGSRVEETPSSYDMGSPRSRHSVGTSFRTPWQQAVSEEAREFGISAAEAAEELSPYWPRHRSSSRERAGSRVLPRPNLGAMGEAKTQRIAQQTASELYGYANASRKYGYVSPRSRYAKGDDYRSYGYHQTRGLSGRSMSEKAAESVMTPQDLGVRTDQFVGLDREGYQTLLSELSGRGVSASDAAHALKQAGYLGQKSVPHLSPRQWNAEIASATGPGVNAAQAAKELSPRYHAATSTGSEDKYKVTNASISVAPGAAIGELGVPRSLASVGEVRGKTSSLAPFTEGYGMYEGQGSRSYRAGTPAKETDIVLSPAEAAAVNAPQHSPRSAETRVTNRPELNFVEQEVRQIARALGINDEGMNKTTLVSAIKGALREMAPEKATQFMGSLSPRTRQHLSNKRGY